MRLILLLSVSFRYSAKDELHPDVPRIRISAGEQVVPAAVLYWAILLYYSLLFY